MPKFIYEEEFHEENRTTVVRLIYAMQKSGQVYRLVTQLPFEPELNFYNIQPAQRTLDKQKHSNATLEKRGLAGPGFVLSSSPSLLPKQHLNAAYQGRRPTHA